MSGLIISSLKFEAFNAGLLKCGILKIDPTFTTFKPRRTPL